MPKFKKFKKMVEIEEKALFLPLEFVQNSVGFSFDFGENFLSVFSYFFVGLCNFFGIFRCFSCLKISCDF